MNKIYLDRDKIMSAHLISTFEGWIKANFQLDVYCRMEEANSKYCNDMCITGVLSAILLFIETIPVIYALTGLSDLTVTGINILCGIAVLSVLVIPTLGYLFAIWHAGKEWYTYKNLWKTAKQTYNATVKKLDRIMEM